MSQRPRYSVVHDPALGRFPWLVVDAAGEPALWRKDHPKVRRVPMRFKTQALAQTAADRLNADGK
jgi:hypothetical protein